jgi:proteasome assembly chaperone (PAC2) family protein
MIIFTGDFNPADPIRLYEIAHEVIKMTERLNINIIYSMGATLKQNMIPTPIDNPIYIVTNNKDILERTKEYDNLISYNGQGQILGFNGLILGLAKEQAIDALCLLGEIDNPNIIQPKTAQLILSVLTQILKIKLLDMSELEEEEKRKNFMEQQVNYFEKVIQEGKSPGIA